MNFEARRGVARQQLGDLAGALADHSRALEIDPRNDYAYGNRAIVNAALGKVDQAQQDLERCTAIDASLQVLFEPAVRRFGRRGTGR